jgi:uncharacterized protein YdeI (YjbR/CyaY-like superfamily)
MSGVVRRRLLSVNRSGEDEMETRKTLYVTSREEWRDWLKKHYQSETEVWLIYYKKHTGRPRISYDHAVEEALCFGWIDSIVKKMDDEKFAQKFTLVARRRASGGAKPSAPGTKQETRPK